MPIDAAAKATLAAWHRMIAANDLGGIAGLCAPDVVFRSPVAFTPYQGADLVAAFLQQAVQVFADFRYHRAFEDGERSVVLEFSARVEDKQLKGIDLIRFDEQGRIVEFEVMIRPFNALQALGAAMGARLGQQLPAFKQKG